MTYPPSGGTPDPYQPQQPYGQGQEPTTPEPYPAPDSGVAYGTQPYGTQPYGTQPYGAQPYGAPPAGYGAPQYPPAGGPYGQGPYGPTPYAPYGYAPRTNGLAIASLACSLAGLLTCISAPVGVVLGHVAKRQIRATGESGEGMATAGLWVGYILSVLGILGIGLYVVVIIFAINNAGTST